MAGKFGFRNIGPEATVDMVGQRVGMLTVEGPAPSFGTGARWNCRCACGGTRVMGGQELRQARKRGFNSSCGCTKVKT